jgi:hypothetical protein
MKINASFASALRILLKTFALFVAANLIYLALSPLPALSQVTVHNTIIPGRMRMQAANSATGDTGYGRATTNIDLMLATHELASAEKAADEYRVLLLGDSAAWGYLLADHETLAAQINAQNRAMMDGRRIRAFNMALPGVQTTSDLLFMQRFGPYAPDLVVWLITPEAFRRAAQKDNALVCGHLERIQAILSRYDDRVDGCSSAPADSLFRRTLVGERRDLAMIVHTQIDGLLWAATGIDHNVLKPRTLARTVEAAANWWELPGPTLRDEDLLLNTMDAAKDLTGGALLVINEPILILNGPNTDVRYNKEYPRWAFDQGTAMIEARAAALQIPFVNLWDAVPADQFTDHELHYTKESVADVARLIGDAIIDAGENDTTTEHAPKD